MSMYIFISVFIGLMLFSVHNISLNIKKRKNIKNRVLSFCQYDVDVFDSDVVRSSIIVRSFLFIGEYIINFHFFPKDIIYGIKKKDIYKYDVDVRILVGSKFGCAILFFLFSLLFLPHMTSNYLFEKIFTAVFLWFGFIVPNVYLDQRYAIYLRSVEMGMGDALDIFLVCAESGLAMEPSMERVSSEMKSLNPNVAKEFRKTVDEMRVNSDQMQAIEALGKRTGIPALERLSAALSQSLETGTPLASVLRILVSEIREEKLTNFEARAAKLSVVLTFPMIIFLLPCMFIIVAGPAIVNVMSILKK
ncbi:type II secretion system F family protein [Acetobacter estunensis]|uniref:type II secretion system F family protein n=1 Tax=Acetobacter estunensis TaxID=104097 RepID=UPI001C2D9B1F|nr:type II secretion system F family protein [Acetobacter estunensis]MBV1836760.1 type II secretion system F family protein [Acetobacter estunensis]